MQFLQDVDQEGNDDYMESADASALIFQTVKIFPIQKSKTLDLLGSLILSHEGYIPMFYSEFTVLHQEDLDQNPILMDSFLKFVEMMYNFKLASLQMSFSKFISEYQHGHFIATSIFHLLE